MGPGRMGPPGDPSKLNEKLKEPKPKHLREVPVYLWRVCKSTFSRLFYIFGMVWKTRPWILLCMLLMAIFNGIMPVIGLKISANLLTGLEISIREKTLHVILVALGFQFGYLLLQSVVSSIYNMLYRIAGELVTNHIKVQIMQKAREVDLASFDKPEFYERLENADREAGMRPVQILSNTFYIFSGLITLASCIAIMSSFLPWAPLVLIAVSVPSAVINFVYRKKNFLYMRHSSTERRQMSYYSNLMVNKDLVKEVRLFGLSDKILQSYQTVFARYFGGIKRLIYAEGGWNIAMLLLSTLVSCGLFVLIALRVIQQGGPIGDFSYYTGALTSIGNCVSSLIATTATIYEGTLFVDNLIYFMQEKKTIIPYLPSGEKPLLPERHIGHTIELSHVSFRYPGGKTDVLHDINLTIHAGESCVLVGLNGAGKTTLIKLLTRLYDPTEGTVYLDGKDIRSYDVTELYRIYGIIFQDFGEYAFSVRDNIAFGAVCKKVDEQAIHNAAEQAAAAPFIRKLPRQYDTPLTRYFSEEGIELSVGQWQKLSVARAFYADSDILILDEPTASLDAIAEQEIFNQFDALRKGKTTLFVSHRLSSATTADRIIVLANGSIAEEGTHRCLMEKQGMYYKLFSTQAQRYRESMDGSLHQNEQLPRDLSRAVREKEAPQWQQL